MLYIHTNKSNKDELQKYLDDVWDVVKDIYSEGTTGFDTPIEKYNTNGFFCLNAKEVYSGKEFVDMIPNHKEFTGLYETGSDDEWIEPIVD